MSNRIRILVADDHPMFRAGVSHTLKGNGAFEVVGEAASAHEAIQLARQLRPDVALLDVSMPGCGLKAAAEIKRTCREVHIVFFTVSETKESVNAALEVGARGFVLKGATGTELARVLQAVCGGESYVAPTMAARLWTQLRQKPPVRERNALSDLTSREEQVLAQVRRGLTNKEIAKNLSLSDKTVKHYMTSILQKLQVRSRVEAVIQLQGQAD